MFHRQAKGAKVWVEVEGRVYRSGLWGFRSLSTSLLHRLVSDSWYVYTLSPVGKGVI